MPPRLIRGLVRCGLGLAGLWWVLCVGVLCGCNSVNGYVMNESGKAYYRRGDYSAARHEFERALMDSPGNPNYAYNVAAAMQQQGDLFASERMYQHALTIDPAHQPSYEGLAHLLYDQGRANESEQLLTSWAVTQPYIPDSNLTLARMQQNRGDLVGAEQSLQRALAANPKHRGTSEEMGRLYRRSGRRRDSAQMYGQAMLQNPWDPNAKAEMAALYREESLPPSLLMASQMPQFDPTMQGGMFRAAPSQDVVPSIYPTYYGPSPYGPLTAITRLGTPASVPRPQSPAVAGYGGGYGMPMSPQWGDEMGQPMLSPDFPGTLPSLPSQGYAPHPQAAETAHAPQWSAQPMPVAHQTLSPTMMPAGPQTHGYGAAMHALPTHGMSGGVVPAGHWNLPPQAAAPQAYPAGAAPMQQMPVQQMPVSQAPLMMPQTSTAPRMMPTTSWPGTPAAPPAVPAF
ncbi:MAG: tetratricopeptide repeat protein [Planctomyces sp.]|nr:tetratricopeptide repeat protein [Planctomyces sp.]